MDWGTRSCSQVTLPGLHSGGLPAVADKKEARTLERTTKENLLKKKRQRLPKLASSVAGRETRSHATGGKRRKQAKARQQESTPSGESIGTRGAPANLLHFLNDSRERAGKKKS